MPGTSSRSQARSIDAPPKRNCPRGLAHVRIDTAAVAARDRFEYWRSRVLPLRLEPLGPDPGGLVARAEVLRSADFGEGSRPGSCIIEMSRGPAAARWTTALGEQQDRLRLIVLAPAPGGAASWYGHPFSIARGGVALAGASDGWWRAPAGMHGIEVDVPRDAVEVTDADLSRLHRDGRLARDPVFRHVIRPMLVGMSGHLAELAASASADLDAAWPPLLRMLVRSLAGQDLAGVDLAPARRARAEHYIRAHLADPGLSPESVALALHVSRRSLYADLPAAAAYIRTQRLERALALLTERSQPVRSVAEIGATVGLPDPSHFSRLFHAVYGFSPRQARAR